jgi:hypothetical protein
MDGADGQSGKAIQRLGCDVGESVPETEYSKTGSGILGKESCLEASRETPTIGRNCFDLPK